MFFLCLNPLVGSCRLWSELRASWPGFSLSLCLLSSHCCSHGSFCPQSSRLVPPEVIPACPPRGHPGLSPSEVIPACPPRGHLLSAPTLAHTGLSVLGHPGLSPPRSSQLVLRALALLFPPPAVLFSRTGCCSLPLQCSFPGRGGVSAPQRGLSRPLLTRIPASHSIWGLVPSAPLTGPSSWYFSLLCVVLFRHQCLYDCLSLW